MKSEKVSRKILQMDAPERGKLPQGAEAFLEAHRALHGAVNELYAPFFGGEVEEKLQPAVQELQGDFHQVRRLLKEVGMYINSSIGVIVAVGNARKAAPEPEEDARGDEA